jgi:hypothetical protein
MFVRRIRRYIAEQNWFGAGAELFIVVLGVFLGMQVTNWNEARLERERGRAYYDRIIEDLRTDIAGYRATAEYYRSAGAHAVAALNALSNPRANLGEQFLIDAYQATQIAPRPQTRGAYDEAVASAGFRFVGDAYVRDRITNYYVVVSGLDAVFNNAPPYRERMRRYMPHDVATAIANACGDRFAPDERGAAVVNMPQGCDPDLTRAQIASAVAQIRSARELRLDLNRQINDLDQKVRSFGLVQAMAETLVAEMEAAR